MFDKFGEFDSAEEINTAAAAQLQEGDTDAIMTIAEENGIDKEDAEDYIDGVVTELANNIMAAMGKLDIEEKDMKPYEIMCDWISYIRIQCEDNEEMAKAVRRKGKSLRGCIAYLLKWSFANQHEIPTDIVKAAGVSVSRVTMGIPGMRTAKKLIMEYYGGDQK